MFRHLCVVNCLNLQFREILPVELVRFKENGEFKVHRNFSVTVNLLVHSFPLDFPGGYSPLPLIIVHPKVQFENLCFYR